MHPRSEHVAVAHAELFVLLNTFQRDRALTTIEMLQGVAAWQSSFLKYLLRSERHPDNPQEFADDDLSIRI